MSLRAFDSEDSNRDLLWIVYGEQLLSLTPIEPIGGFWGFVANAKQLSDELVSIGVPKYTARVNRPILCKPDPGDGIGYGAAWMHPDKGASLLYFWGNFGGGSLGHEVNAPKASATYDKDSGEVRVTVNLLPMPRADLSDKWIVLQYSYRTTENGPLQNDTSSPIALPNMSTSTTTFTALNIGANLYSVSVGFVEVA